MNINFMLYLIYTGPYSVANLDNKYWRGQNNIIFSSLNLTISIMFQRMTSLLNNLIISIMLQNM